MDSLSFVYWLRGYMELRENKEGMTEEQVQIINKHIELVLEDKSSKFKNLIQSEPIRTIYPYPQVSG